MRGLTVEEFPEVINRSRKVVPNAVDLPTLSGGPKCLVFALPWTITGTGQFHSLVSFFKSLRKSDSDQ